MNYDRLNSRNRSLSEEKDLTAIWYFLNAPLLKNWKRTDRACRFGIFEMTLPQNRPCITEKNTEKLLPTRRDKVISKCSNISKKKNRQNRSIYLVSA